MFLHICNALILIICLCDCVLLLFRWFNCILRKQSIVLNLANATQCHVDSNYTNANHKFTNTIFLIWKYDLSQFCPANKMSKPECLFPEIQCDTQESIEKMSASDNILTGTNLCKQ